MILHDQPTFSNKQELESFIGMVVKEEFDYNSLDKDTIVHINKDLLELHKNLILDDFNKDPTIIDMVLFHHLFLPIATYKNLFDRNNKQRLKALNNCAPAIRVNINKIYDNVLALLLMSKYGWCINSDSMINIYQYVYLGIISLLYHNSVRHFTIADNFDFLTNIDNDIVIMLSYLNTRLFKCCHALELQENFS